MQTSNIQYHQPVKAFGDFSICYYSVTYKHENVDGIPVPQSKNYQTHKQALEFLSTVDKSKYPNARCRYNDLDSRLLNFSDRQAYSNNIVLEGL
ncbi:MAG: hypothetical protein KAI17_22790 [Thiotrichaceae bacterium]|nr:hypothetical protein [Thiotrichaceae bacterium]